MPGIKSVTPLLRQAQARRLSRLLRWCQGQRGVADRWLGVRIPGLIFSLISVHVVVASGVLVAMVRSG
ncbi:hypothetical protein WCLP8_4880009 [uncultured Gammaproteobacteria bacterium]